MKRFFTLTVLFVLTLSVTLSLHACDETELKDYSGEAWGSDPSTEITSQDGNTSGDLSDSLPPAPPQTSTDDEPVDSEEVNSSSINLSVAPPSDKYRQYDEEVDGDLVRDVKISSSTGSLTFPFTVQDMFDIGYGLNEEPFYDEVDAERYLSVGLNMTAPGNSQKVFVVIYNPGDEPCHYSECLVTTFATAADNISVNGITVNQTSYEDMLETFGKSNMFQTDTFEAEKASGRLINFVYKATSASAQRITLSCEIAKETDRFGFKEGLVKHIEISVKAN